MNRQQRRAADRARSRARGSAEEPHELPAVVARARELVQRREWQRAEAHTRQALEGDPGLTACRMLLAFSLHEQGRSDEAILEVRRVLSRAPEDPSAHEMLGHVLMRQDRIPEAMTAFERAVDIAPDRATAHLGFSGALFTMGLLGQALEHARLATKLRPDDSGGYNEIGRAEHAMANFAAAAQAYDAARLRSSDDRIEWNRALALLGAGELAEGWDAYEHGLASGARRPKRDLPVPQWSGEDLSDVTLMVWREQGLGDEVRFASCYPDVIEAAGQVTIEATTRLVPLFARSFPDATVRGETFDRREERETTSFEGVDFHSPAGSLARFVRPTIGSFPRQQGYLAADPVRREQFRDRLATIPPGLRVGICWRSMNLATERLSHYTTLDEWEPVLRLPGMTFVNLQYGDATLRETELDDAEARTGTVVHRWKDVDYTVDLEEVAALTAELDVVIGPNTFSTILAGALGVPTLVIGLPAIWQHGQEREPWTPSALHLTRRWDQSWAPVMERAAEELQQRASA